MELNYSGFETHRLWVRVVQPIGVQVGQPRRAQVHRWGNSPNLGCTAMRAVLQLKAVPESPQESLAFHHPPRMYDHQFGASLLQRLAD
jgi:hypothetical protein